MPRPAGSPGPRVPALAAVAVLGYSVPPLGAPPAAFLGVGVVPGEIAHRGPDEVK
ncbi:hypothetical protein AB0L59_37575 [Streptomyces sp. NPDC052109]|uniref:hypothetical protein n=1 Tax=Streptomyces sp. NPDC052109 TaxID=3155527 RepID=UPI0034149BC6